jgi:hypothetical protein
MNQREAQEIYTKNNAGEGFSPPQETVAEAVAAYVSKGAAHVVRSETTDDVDVVRIDGALIAIGGDARGAAAWAVEL